MVLAIAWALTPSLGESQTLPTLVQVDGYMDSELERQRIPGAFVGVLRNGEVLHARGYGVANLEHQVPVDEHTLFQSGSLGKQFIAAAVLVLVEDGKSISMLPSRRTFRRRPRLGRASRCATC